MGDAREREPCPHRIIDDTGSAFGLGCVGGSVFYFFKGARNSPRKERMAGALQAVQGNARRLGGSFAMWGGFFSVFDCTFAAIRGREDPYNSIGVFPTPICTNLLHFSSRPNKFTRFTNSLIPRYTTKLTSIGLTSNMQDITSGFCTGAILAIRGGAKSAALSGVFGGVILAVIEGLNIAVTNYMSAMPALEPPPVEAVPVDPADQPWYIRMIAPAQPKQNDVDFSDPKEMAAAPGFGDNKDDYSKTERKWASPLEPRIGSQTVWMLINAHTFAAHGRPSAAGAQPTRS